MSLLTTPAILLRSHPYSETSRILRFLSREAGVVSAMARGVRRPGSRSAPGLDTFAQGALTLYVKQGRDLQTLKEFTIDRPRRGLGRDPLRLAAAAVIGELVLRHGGEGGDAALFDTVAESLDVLEHVEHHEVAGHLLAEGWGIVGALGYQPQLGHCPRCGRELGANDVGRFDFEAAGVRCGECSVGSSGPRVGPGARAQLEGLLERQRPDSLEHLRPHLQLLSDFITYHVAGTRPLEAFRVLAALLPARTDPTSDSGAESS